MLLPIGINTGDGDGEIGGIRVEGRYVTREPHPNSPCPLNSLGIILICHYNRVGIGQQAARDPLAQRAGLWKQVWRQQIMRRMTTEQPAGAAVRLSRHGRKLIAGWSIPRAPVWYWM